MVTWVESARGCGYGCGPYGYIPYGKIWTEWSKPNYYWDEELPYSADLSDNDIYLSNVNVYVKGQSVWKPSSWNVQLSSSSFWNEEIPYDADLSDDDIYLSNQYIYLVSQNVWKITWTKEW